MARGILGPLKPLKAQDAFEQDRKLRPTLSWPHLIALGIGAAMTTLTVFHVLSGDPIPEKSGQLFYVQLDPEAMQGYRPGEEPETQLTRFDAEALLAQKRGLRQVMTSGGQVVITPEKSGATPELVDARYASGDFFRMFDVPLQFGRGWTAAEDEGKARAAVLSKETNDKQFGGADSTGKTLRIDGNEFRIIGVLGPKPQLADLETLELKLDEAILQETPPLERGQPLLKLLFKIPHAQRLVLGALVVVANQMQEAVDDQAGEPVVQADALGHGLAPGGVHRNEDVAQLGLGQHCARLALHREGEDVGRPLFLAVLLVVGGHLGIVEKDHAHLSRVQAQQAEQPVAVLLEHGQVEMVRPGRFAWVQAGRHVQPSRPVFAGARRPLPCCS